MEKRNKHLVIGNVATVEMAVIATITFPTAKKMKL
jgi:hypothetical protein